MKSLSKRSALFLASLITISTVSFNAKAAAPTRLENGDIQFTESGNMGAVRVTITSGKIVANAPISAINICVNVSRYGFKDVKTQSSGRSTIISLDSIDTYLQNCSWVTINNDSRLINFAGASSTYLKIGGITIRGGSLNLPEDMKAAGTPIIVSFQTALEKLTEFTGGIKKTDQRHIMRLKQALQNALTKFMDKDGNMILPVTHEVVRENSRLIMVLATVLNELLVDYDEVESLKVPIEYLKSLSSQIRSAYGWNEGLAGSASKSLTALGTVIDLEIREVYSTMGAAGVTDISSMNNLLKATQIMINRVKASNGGDANSSDVVNNFATTWNSAQVQTILGQLMNAPADVAGLIQPKLKLLFMAVESLSDLTNTGLLLPDGGSQGIKVGKKK
jgi:hypothetical protein